MVNIIEMIKIKILFWEFKILNNVLEIIELPLKLVDIIISGFVNLTPKIPATIPTIKPKII